MSLDIVSLWYRPRVHWLLVPLLPFSWLFGLIVIVRRWLYQANILKSYDFHVPVIVVGNITLGGTGKTPFIIWLANFLRDQGYKPGIVSRGVGGEEHHRPHEVNLIDDPRIVGDEALLLLQGNCPVVICTDRAAAVQKLLQLNCNIALSDDGLQHYRLDRNLEIVIIDGDRRFGNGQWLPAGPLREGPRRLASVDLVVVNNGNARDAWRMQLETRGLVSLKDKDQQWPLNRFFGKKVHAVAGIGNPDRFFKMLTEAGLEIIPHVFPDHFQYSAQDIDFPDNLSIIMTEKDAVKCRDFANERCWYLPVTAKIDNALQNKIIEMIKAIGSPA